MEARHAQHPGQGAAMQPVLLWGGKAQLVSSTGAGEVYSCLGVRCCTMTKAHPLQKDLILPHPPGGS